MQFKSESTIQKGYFVLKKNIYKKRDQAAPFVKTKMFSFIVNTETNAMRRMSNVYFVTDLYINSVY